MNTYVINLDAALENHPETDPGNVQESYRVRLYNDTLCQRR
jgi:hypothetical protein